MEKSSTKSLYGSFLHLKNEEEIQHFLRDLCTRAELDAMEERWEIAQLVDQGLPYRKIAELTGASTTTVTRVAQWVRKGRGGYVSLLEKIKK